MKNLSIVIRSRNDAKLIGEVLKAIYAQTVKDFEILVLDNSSSDDTLNILSKFPDIKVFNIKEGEYVPGKVLNMAVKNCEGEIVVFNNSDSIPQNKYWLENLIKPILEGDAVACYARQSPRKDADWWVKFDYSRAFSNKEFNTYFFSMASSAAKLSVLKKYPFDEDIKYSEDVFWAKKLRDLGLKVLYVPNAVAEHSHNYSIPEIKKRFTGEGIADAHIYKTKFPALKMLKGIPFAIIRDFIHLVKIKKISKIFDSVKIRFTQKYSYFIARNKEVERISK